MNDDAQHARGWLLKAESDLSTAQRLLEGEGPYDTACFHAQQAVEKLLKGFLASRGRPIPYVHNVEDLWGLCSDLEPHLRVRDLPLAELTPYAVELRYDFDFWPEREVAEAAVETALQVRAAILGHVPREARP